MMAKDYNVTERFRSQATATPLLEVRDLTVALPEGADRINAVDGISYRLDPGKITCIVGESGSGKSMTANAIMGLLPKPHVKVTAGALMFEGDDLLTRSEADMRKVRGAEISMIFQEPMTALNPLMTVGQQIAEVIRKTEPLPRAAMRRRIAQLLAEMHLPEPETMQDSYPFRLSGGQRQRVMIAMALALKPKLLIADEPTTALDVTTQKQILGLIREQQLQHDMGVMFITHDFGVVAEIADHIVVMERGKVVEEGSVEAVLNTPKHPYTRKLIAAVPTLNDHARTSPAATPLLSVQNACKTFKSRSGFFGGKREVSALNSVSFNLHEGEIIGLVGESGSGKSTLARSIMRLSDIDKGQITIDGKPIDAPELDLPTAIQFVFQDPYASLNPRRRIGRALTIGPMQHGTPKEEAWDRAREMIKIVGLDESVMDRFPHEFSGGQRQRIGIARALTMKPRILIADEAVSALDVSVQKQVLRLLEDIRLTMGIAILFVTHDLRVAATICHRLLVMKKGEVVEQGSTKSIFANPKSDYTRALLDAVPGKSWQKPILEETL
ncbi:ABC transporter ATP-binding protein [Sulfitobacter pontiacus]|uniref:ABC transporter ATP-binding protein n=1 Tax=Sulfitobacter pontiacus TaxID=60137 RepID=UPI000445805E|nr:ABC transporter ATP-binding protein [Sulfitobacter pontiacus]KAJ30977.1 ABC transporter ATP-binding protein [Sulfitobacter pontiacus 3SOLIMAR09]